MQPRKSFILHFDSLDVLEELDIKQQAELFIAIRDYNLGKDVKLTGLMKAVFVSFQKQFDRDIEKYNDKCLINADNGNKGGRPKKTQNNPEKPSGIKGNPKKPYNDNDNDNDNKKETYIGANRSEVLQELNKIIDQWNNTWSENRIVTKKLQDVYLNVRKTYSKDVISKALTTYKEEKKDSERQYRLDPLRFFSQSNGYLTYV